MVVNTVKLEPTTAEAGPADSTKEKLMEKEVINNHTKAEEEGEVEMIKKKQTEIGHDDQNQNQPAEKEGGANCNDLKSKPEVGPAAQDVGQQEPQTGEMTSTSTPVNKPELVKVPSVSASASASSGGGGLLEEGNGEEGKDLITIQVKDHLGIVATATEAQVFVVPSEATFGEFLVDVSNRFALPQGDFDVIFQDKHFQYNLAAMPSDSTFLAINVVPDRDRVYKMSLDIVLKKRKVRDVDTPKEVLVRRNLSNDFDMALAGSGLASLNTRDYVGLRNKNMTCYLNSFLQGLWFTPEFRNVLYNYFYEPGKSNRKSLGVPLQRLFLQLQLSSRDSVDTDDLIKTFGWEDRETWNQHDIEELCSIFMDNLITEFKGTHMDGIIKALYFGTLDDYVKCLECNRVSQRVDDFLVIPLPIRNFGSLLPNPTLEEALNSFVAYEVLDGNNMYNCSQCEKPCPAHKGLKFNRLPYILTIQLKRFEYDFIKDRRLKLNDRVAFPLILDMNPYIENPSPDRREALKIDLIRPKSMDEGRTLGHSRPTVQLNTEANEAESDETVEGAAGGAERSTTEIMKEMVEKNGPEIYQLYGVMVHRGGINSGHYYAYILDFEREKWYRCDDAVIRKASISDIEGAYGGASDEDRELTSAYMLLYRRFDPSLNLLPYYLHEMPPHMQEMWRITAEMDRQLQAEEELAKNTIRISCFMRDVNTTELVEKTLQIPKTMSVADAAVLISQEFADVMPFPGLDSSDKIRLCRFDKDLLVIENSFDGLDEENIVAVLKKYPPRTKNEALFVERKKNDFNFQTYTADDIIFRTHLADSERQLIYNPREVHAQLNTSVDELKATIVSELELGANCTGLILVTRCMGLFTPIIGDKHPMSLFNFERINDIYAHPGTEDLIDKVLSFVDKYTKAEIILIYAQIPQTPPDTTAKVDEVEKMVNELSLEPADIKKLSDAPNPQQSVASGTEAERKEAEVKVDDISTPPPSLIVNGNAESELVGHAGGGGDANELLIQKNPADEPKYAHFIQIAYVGSVTDDNIMAYTIRIDGQTPLYSLSKFISSLLRVPETDFIFYKADKTETVELRKMSERIASMKPFDHLYVKLGHRLQDGEYRIPVFLLSVKCTEKPIQYLTEIICTLGMTVDQVRSAIIKNCVQYCNDFKIDKSKLRVRKKLRTNPSKVMREHMKIQDLFTPYSIQTGELYVQLVDDATNITDKNYLMIFRHWHPSLGVLDPPVEVTLFHDYTEDLEDIILAKLRESLGIGEEVELEAAKPDTGFPWEVPPRLIGDLGWFPISPSVKKSLYVYSDELALFVRDKNEPAMDPEKLEPFRPRYMLDEVSPPSPVQEPQRKETGLKMNLGNSPSK